MYLLNENLKKKIAILQPFILPVGRLFIAPVFIVAGALVMQPHTSLAGMAPQIPHTETSPSSNAQNPAKDEETDIPVTGDGSLNWAGYVADKSDKYNGVSGSWVVPSVAAAPGNSGEADATWIGVGGVSSQDLIQVGTQALIGNSGVVYEAWYELLPRYSTPISMDIHPGDTVHASIVKQASDQWLLSISDTTTGQNFSRSVAYGSSQSSAEWIEEMISNGDYTFRPLDTFGKISFNDASVIVGNQVQTLGEAGAQPLNMVNDSGQVLAGVSAISASSPNFTVSRTSAPAVASRPARYFFSDSATVTPSITVVVYTHRRHRDLGDWYTLSL